MEFDELISNGQLTKAARLFAKEYYDSGRMGNTRRLLIERLADKCDKYDAAIARQSVKSEEVAEAISWAEKNIREFVKQLKDLAETKERYDYQIKIGEPWKWEWEKSWRALAVEQFQTEKKSAELAITALQAYQPWIPVSERLPTEDDKDKGGYVLTRFSDRAIESWKWDEISSWNEDNNRSICKLAAITHWRPMLPEPPKGECESGVCAVPKIGEVLPAAVRKEVE